MEGAVRPLTAPDGPQIYHLDGILKLSGSGLSQPRKLLALRHWKAFLLISPKRLVVNDIKNSHLNPYIDKDVVYIQSGIRHMVNIG